MKAPKNPKSDPAPAKSGPAPENETLTETNAAPEQETEAEAPPEPWTTERVVEWNRYYDLYVAAAALLLVFLVSTHKLTNSSIWPMIQAGRRTLQEGFPLLKDPFAYTTMDRAWINVSWLYQVVAALLMKVGPALAPTDPAQQFQLGATALVLFTALGRVITGASLMAVRRPGPGAWWSAIALTLGLGIVIGPPGPTTTPLLGGLAGLADVSSAVWGTCFLALEMLALFRMYDQGRRGAAWWLVPLFLLWANVDESFLLGLIVLGLTVVGQALRPSRTSEDGDRPANPIAGGLILLALCAGVCFINPSLHQAFAVASQPFRYMVQTYPASEMPTDYLGFFDSRSAAHYQRVTGLSIRAWQAYFFAYLGLGLLSFVLNRQRFSLARFLVFVVLGLIWGLANRMVGAFAVVFVATLALNGQEWYLDRFGAEGRLGWKWATWSVGGRLVTLTVLTLAMIKALTGLGSQPGEAICGLGADLSDFSFDAADALRAANLRGRVLNTSASIGDDLIWRTDGQVQAFFDSRRGLYGPSFYDYRSKLVKALRDGQKEGEDGWRKPLDDYHVSAVVVRTGFEPRLEEALRASPDWVEVYFDGSATIFGRMDTEYPEDLAYFKAQAIDYEAMAFRRERPVPAPDRPPSTPNEFLDLLDRRRVLESTEPHNIAAQRYLQPPRGSTQPVPEPAQCLLAIREARTALSRKPDDPDSFRILALAYQALMQHEGELLLAAGVEPSPQVLTFRKRQIMTALNYAIQTTPPPTTAKQRESLKELHVTMSQELRRGEAFDLEIRHLEAAAKLSAPEPLDPALNERLNQLREGIDKFKENLETKTVEDNLRPFQRAQAALQAGAVGLALEELRKEEGVPRVKPDLVDLYCSIGQPDEGYTLMRNDGLEDPELSTGPGTAAYRQGLVTLLALGNYDAAASFWYERALTQVRTSMTMEGLMAARGLIAGEAMANVSTNLELPSRVLAEADWCYQLGLCLLEGGRPLGRVIDISTGQPGAPPRQQEVPGAAEMFERALQLEPDLPVKPIIAFYLEKMGRPLAIEPTPEPENKTEATPAQTPPAETPNEKTQGPEAP